MDKRSEALVQRLAEELKRTKTSSCAIALDFDGVCRLFTEYKHQIMFTNLFLHLREFQRVPFGVLRDAYVYINFRSPDFAGKERFLCVDALSRYLAGKGHACDLPGMHRAVDALKQEGLKINEKNLLRFGEAEDVARAIGWSREVDRRLADLSEISLTPGIREHIFEPFRARADFFVVSTATEESLRKSLEKDSVDFIKRYIGQETAGKAEALLAIAGASYSSVVFFGDSLEDSRAAAAAGNEMPSGSALFFAPVIPGDEEQSFAAGRKIIEAAMAGKARDAEQLSAAQVERFKGREAGSRAVAPVDIRG